MIKDDKLFLNLEEQVQKNKEDITYLLTEGYATNLIGIKVQGQVNTANDLPDPTEYLAVEGHAYGDTYAVGTIDNPPYEYYVFTRPFGPYLTDHWFNIGVFPGPSYVPGPVGPAPNLSIGSVSATTGSPEASITGTNPDYQLNLILKTGPQGPVGPAPNLSIGSVSATTGSPEAYITGTNPNYQLNLILKTGPQGPVGERGSTGVLYEVAGALTATSQLPDPSTVPTSTAYVVKIDSTSYLYGIILNNGNPVWYNWGSFTQGAQGPRGETGIGIDTLTKREDTGTPTVQYNTTNGMTISGNEKYTYTTDDGTQTHTSQYEVDIPIIAGTGISIGANANNTGIVITNGDHAALDKKLDKMTTTTSYAQAYVKAAGGNQIAMNISANAIAGSIINRDGNGRANIATPTENSHIANKVYVDLGDAQKVDKKTTTGYYAYTHDGSTQAELKISQSNDGSTLVQRNSAGRITATYPTAAEHCATKGYVDDNMPHLYMHTIYNNQSGPHASDFTFTFYSIKNTKYTTTGELYSAETNLHDKWIAASGYAYEEGTNHPVNAASITTAGISYTYSEYGGSTSYSGSIQDDIVLIF